MTSPGSLARHAVRSLAVAAVTAALLAAPAHAAERADAPARTDAVPTAEAVPGGEAGSILTPDQQRKLAAVQGALVGRDAAALAVTTAVDGANLAAEAAGRAAAEAADLRRAAAVAQLEASEKELRAAKVRLGVEVFARDLAIAGPGSGQQAVLGLVLHGERPAEMLREMEATERISDQTAQVLREVVAATEDAQAARTRAAAAADTADTAQAAARDKARDAAGILASARQRLGREQSRLAVLAEDLPLLADASLPATLTPTGDLGCLPAVAGVTFSNGMLPPAVLCGLPTPGHKLRTDAASSFERLAVAYERQIAEPLCITDSYRTYQAQVELKKRKPDLAAQPGTSNHGWGLAVDACGGIESFATREHEWMRANAPLFGWFHPGWAQQDGSKPEPWHWEFSPELAEQMATTFAALDLPKGTRVAPAAATGPKS